MQASAPVVPVVIRNTYEVMTRGSLLFRPGSTVQVSVLPPIDVIKWKVEDLDRHVAHVRALFQRTLDDWPALGPGRPKANEDGPSDLNRGSGIRACRRREAQPRHPDRTKRAVVLEAVKVWPGNGGACRKVGATANLDGFCARRRKRSAGLSEERDSKSNKETDERSRCAGVPKLLDKKAPYKAQVAQTARPKY